MFVFEIELPCVRDLDAPSISPFVQIDESASVKCDSARLERVVGRALEVRASSYSTDNTKLRIVERVVHSLSLTVEFYNNVRIKTSLGGMNIREYRERLEPESSKKLSEAPCVW